MTSNDIQLYFMNSLKTVVRFALTAFLFIFVLLFSLVSVSDAEESADTIPAIAIDVDPGREGCQLDSTLTLSGPDELFGFAVYAGDPIGFSYVDLDYSWDSRYASVYANRITPDIPADVFDINGVTGLETVPEKNIISYDGAGIAMIAGRDDPGFRSISYMPAGGGTLPTAAGLLGFAVFRTTAAFADIDSLVLTVTVRFHDVRENSTITARAALTVYNKKAPSLELLYPAGGEILTAGGTCRVRWASMHVTSVALDYSLDGGESWNRSVSGIDARSGSCEWIVPVAATEKCMIRLAAEGDPAPASVSSGEIVVVTPPLVAVSVLTGAGPGLIPFRYRIDNPSNGIVSLRCHFSRDGGVNWGEATVDRNLRFLSSGRYTGIFIWDAGSDLGTYTGDILFRLTADNTINERAVVKTVGVDVHRYPHIGVSAVPDVVTGPVTFDFTVTAHESGPFDVLAEVSRDGTLWEAATIADKTTVQTRDGCEGKLTWLSTADVPDGLYSGVSLRLTVSGPRESGNIVIGPLVVDNDGSPSKGSVYGGYPGGVPVLALHNVDYSIYDNDKFSVTPLMLERLILELKAEGYSFLSTGEYLDYIVKGEPVPAKSVLLSFDDGYRTMFTRLFPILQKHNVKAAVNLICSRIGSSSYLTTWHMKAMYETGLVDFQSHSFNLHDYDNDRPLIFRNSQETDIRYTARIKTDLWASMDIIGDVTGERPRMFVAPFGAGDETVEKIVRDAGLDGLCYIGSDVMNSYGHNPYHLERITVYRYNVNIMTKLIRSGQFATTENVAGKATVPSVSQPSSGARVVMAVKIPGGIVSSSPAIAPDGTVYLGSWDNSLYAIGSDGDIQWTFATENGISSSPAIGPDGTIYVGSYDLDIYAILPDGSFLWKYDCWDPVYSSPAVCPDGTVVVGSTDGGLVGMNPDGTRRFNYRSGDAIFSSPAVDAEGNIYVGTWNNKLLSLTSAGEKRWVFYPDKGVESSPALGADGTVYAAAMNGKLYALTSGGEVLWSLELGDWIDTSPVIGPDGVIYIGARDGCLYAVDSDGSIIWRFRTGSWIEAAPLVGADGTIYVCSMDGHLYAVSPGGAELWRFQTGGAVAASPNITDDGIIYVASTDSYLYGIDTGTGTGLASSPWPRFRGNSFGTGTSPGVAAAKAALPEEKVDSTTPDTFRLGDPFPNPFNAVTLIRFTLPRAARTIVTIRNTTGQAVETLADKEFATGEHILRWDADGMPSGVYIVTVKSGKRAAAKKVTLMK